MRYRYCAEVLSSNLRLPELKGASGRARWSVHFAAPALPAVRRDGWHTHWKLPRGKFWLSIASNADGHLLRFHDLADFEIDVRCSAVVCHPLRKVPPATLRHLLLDQVLPLLISGTGKLVLHASAVAIQSDVIAFVGKTGQGKSTLCAGLLRKGARLICDDSLVLSVKNGSHRTIPSYSDIRLWPSMAKLLPGTRGKVSHYSNKVRVRQRSPVKGAARLKALFILGRPARTVGAKRLSPQRAFQQLLPHVFRLTPRDPACMQREFLALGRLVQSVPVFRLRYPRLIEALEHVCAGVRSAAEC